MVGALLLAGTGAGAVAQPVGALDCAPTDYICQQLAADQGTQASDSAQLTAIQGELNDVVKQVNDLVAYINRLNVQVAAAQALVDATQAQINALDAKIRVTEADITRRTAQLDVRQGLFDQRVRSIDQHGTVNYLALALSSTSFNQLIDRLLTAQAIIQADHKLIGDLQAQKTQIQQLDDQLASQRAQEATLLAQQQAARDALQQKVNQQQAALAYQQQLEAKYRAEAQALAAEKAQIDSQVAADQAAYAAEAAASGGGTGQFIWPENPHYISQYYGCSSYPFEMYWPACPTRHLHSGIDIAEPYGTPVLAADNGVANIYSSGYGYGNYVVLTHGNGYATLYGHLASFNVGNGQLVVRGQVIAYEGSTGNSTGPHLHFEIRYQGAYTDPCSYLGC
jgi:murein DD-endopeptidase MepM/ murein hydrolase activator NlpD